MSDVNTRGLVVGSGAIYALAIEFSLCRLLVLIAIPFTLGAQGNNQAGTGDTEDKRILGIFTNNRTTEESMNRTKLTPSSPWLKCRFFTRREGGTAPTRNPRSLLPDLSKCSHLLDDRS